jgi:hypothetical protein
LFHPFVECVVRPHVVRAVERNHGVLLASAPEVTHEVIGEHPALTRPRHGQSEVRRLVTKADLRHTQRQIRDAHPRCVSGAGLHLIHAGVDTDEHEDALDLDESPAHRECLRWVVVVVTENHLDIASVDGSARLLAPLPVEPGGSLDRLVRQRNGPSHRCVNADLDGASRHPGDVDGGRHARRRRGDERDE